MGEFKRQFCPGSSDVAKNRRAFLDKNKPLGKVREIPDEDIVLLLGHRRPGQAYESLHPPLDEVKEPPCPIKELVEPTPGARHGDRIRTTMFSDSIFNAPLIPWIRAMGTLSRFRGIDIVPYSSRTLMEMRERDLEAFMKAYLESEFFDPARTTIKGRTAHGVSLRLDKDGLMFDALRRYVYDKERGEVAYVRNQFAEKLERPVYVGRPYSEEEARARSMTFSLQGTRIGDDPELIECVFRRWMLMTIGGLNPEKASGR